MSKDDIGDRIKSYEDVESDRRLDVHLPIYARIDGRGFSKFTKGMKRPYDVGMSDAMIETTRHLVDKTHARIGYTQSDEISLVFLASETEGSDIFFNGRVQKLVSVLSGIATAAFTRAILTTPGMEHYADRLPHFDCRVFQLPSLMEASNAFLWRVLDAKKNAVSMAARSEFSHNALMNKSSRDMREMMAEKGVDFESYPAFFKEGSWLRRETFERAFTPEELERIPEKYRPDPETTVQRSEVKTIEMNFLSATNKVDIIFNGAQPDFA